MQKTQRKDKDRTDSILACVAFFGIFMWVCCVSAHRASALDPESVVL